MKSLLTLLLALVIVLTSQHAALARGMTHDVAGQVVLCTGHGSVTITLDAQGLPLGGTGDPVHICPDCVLTMIDNADPWSPLPVRVIHSQTLTQTAIVTSQFTVIPRRQTARGPPA